MNDFQPAVAPCRALLVDSDSASIDLWRGAVLPKSNEITYSIVASVSEAFALTITESFNIIFVDVSGELDEDVIQLMEALQARENQPFFVLITEEETLEMIQRANRLGLDDFIVKGPLYREEVSLHMASFIERYRLQEALEMSVESYRDLFEMNPLPVLVVLAETGKVSIANQSAQRLLGRSVEELENSHLSNWFENMGDEQLNFFHQPDERLKVTILDPLILRENQVKEQRLRGRFRSFQFGLVRAFQLTIEDVSKLEREAQSIGYLSVRETEAEKLAAVGQILSKVAHEINNPMSVIMGLTLLLMEQPELAAHREDLETLQRSAERCNNVLQDVLRFTRMQGISAKNLVLDELVREVTERFNPQCEGQGIDLEVQLGTNGESISGDSFLLEHVLVAIMTNAQEAILRGYRGSRITLATSTRDNEIWLEVINDGPEIPKNLWGQIFAPFYTTKRKGDGIGLSMFYCYGVINEHFGNLTLERSDEEETCFRIRLPLCEGGIVTVEESERLSQATPARIGVILIPPEKTAVMRGIQTRLEEDPTLQIHIVETEDDLLDKTASLQPELIVVHGDHLEFAEETVGALKCLLFRGAPEIFMFREESNPAVSLPDTLVWEGKLPHEEEAFFEALFKSKSN